MKLQVLELCSNVESCSIFKAIHLWIEYIKMNNNGISIGATAYTEFFRLYHTHTL